MTSNEKRTLIGVIAVVACVRLRLRQRYSKCALAYLLRPSAIGIYYFQTSDKYTLGLNTVLLSLSSP